MRSKYGNRKTEVDGRLFDSKREANRYSELLLLEKAGEISDLVCQAPFDVVVNNKHICYYKADFQYITKEGETVVEDVKGVRTDVFILKKKLVEALYDITIVEIK